ncbi:hypothetical protein RF11_03351 [Thelohanellus kitauei]|uniref:Uncharacterized protein n=1 Tax=Thelohanellus kitauei TaxID=669202 RepID=A0A0C2MDC4_THEKT|nr:hypothetical protein RF11_03351 [Thelohanellus kitauei]
MTHAEEFMSTWAEMNVLIVDSHIMKIRQRKILKVEVVVEPNHITINENSTVKLSFEGSSNYHPFGDRGRIDNYVSEEMINTNTPDEYQSFKMIRSLILILSVWLQNTDLQVKFRLRLTNNGDFLTHLLSDDSLSMPCKITISDIGFSRVLTSIPDSMDYTKSHARFQYNRPTLHGGEWFFIQNILTLSFPLFALRF